MKKLSILTAFLCVSVFTFAQVATITQVNEEDAPTVATVEQTGNNQATVTQNNLSNIVVPEGNSISAVVNQTNDTKHGVKNTVTVMQDNEDNDGAAGSLLTTSATQLGTGNDIQQIQKNDASRNEFISRDFSAEQEGKANVIYQESLDGDQGSVVFKADQDGKRNYAEQITNMAGGSTASTPGSVSTMDILQEGDDNKAWQSIQSLDATGDIDQYGKKNEATQTFGNITKENHGKIYQGEDGNDATENKATQEFVGNHTKVSELTATQTGTGNFSMQKVDGSGGENQGRENVGTVTQDGTGGSILETDGNWAKQVFTNGSYNTADINQTGSDNDSEQDVQGNNNKLKITQEQDDDPTAPAPAPAVAVMGFGGHPGGGGGHPGGGSGHPGGGGGTPPAPAIVYNNTIGNYAYQLAEGDGNGTLCAEIDQIGNYNKAEQFYYGNNNDAKIIQFGLGLTAKQEFEVGANGNKAKIDQSGYNNTATQDIDGSDNGLDCENPLTITQGGHDNTANQVVEGDGNGQNCTMIEQLGTNGMATQNFLGDLNDGMITQSGDMQTATQNFMADSENNAAKIAQSGNNNTATQTIYGFENGDCENPISIEQVGSYGTVTQVIDGVNSNGNAMTAFQAGKCNLIEQSAIGNNNESYVSQAASSSCAKAYVDQDGNGNFVDLSQSVGHSYADIYQEGNCNEVRGLEGSGAAINNESSTLTITQMGNNHDAWVSQTATGVGTIDQSGNGNIATINQY